MRCELDYCIYNHAKECSLETIEVNAFGMCDDCILLTLDEEILEEVKRMQAERAQPTGEEKP